ncbi:hypothetical protein BDR06DRAFT_224450 [Suillus hirtellus]|nr:hypothetical protein BDR06DRAFT_224450 [Suillus hirtellus]
MTCVIFVTTSYSSGCSPDPPEIVPRILNIAVFLLIVCTLGYICRSAVHKPIPLWHRANSRGSCAHGLQHCKILHLNISREKIWFHFR